MATTETNGTILDIPIWNSREPDRVVLDTAKTLAPYCSLQHLVKSDIIDALNNNSEITAGNILLTNIGKVVDQLKERKLFLAPGATLGFSPDIGQAIQGGIKTCNHELDYPITRGEILMAINGFSKLNQTEGVVETDIRGVVDLLKSLNRPLTPDAFLPVGFQKDLQTAILAAIRCIDPLRGVQIPIAPMAPSNVFLNPPPPIVPPPPAPPLCQSTL